MKTGIIIQARTSSTRLPNKVLMPLSGKEMLWHVVERVKHSKLADIVIVATSDEKSDDLIAKFCTKHNYKIFRGSLDNVLDRYYHCAKEHELDIIVRITSDCPLVDPKVIDGCISLFLKNRKNGVEYVSNIAERIYPPGLDCEVFTFTSLENAHKNAKDGLDTEHVTPYIMRTVKFLPYFVEEALRGDVRLTVDEPSDYEFMSQLYESFYQDKKIIDVRDVLRYLKSHPEITVINNSVEPKYGRDVDKELFMSNPHYNDVYERNR